MGSFSRPFMGSPNWTAPLGSPSRPSLGSFYRFSIGKPFKPCIRSKSLHAFYRKSPRPSYEAATDHLWKSLQALYKKSVQACCRKSLPTFYWKSILALHGKFLLLFYNESPLSSNQQLEVPVGLLQETSLAFYRSFKVNSR